MKSGVGSNVSSSVSGLTEHDYIGLSEASSCSTTSSCSNHNIIHNNNHNRRILDGSSPAAADENDTKLSLSLSLGFESEEAPAPRTHVAKFLTAEDLQSRAVVAAIPAPENCCSRVPCSAPVSSGTKRLHRDSSSDDSPDGNEIPKSQVVGWPPINTFRSRARPTQYRPPLFVKVNMEGRPIGRKLDLNAHDSYEALTLALEDMFPHPTGKNGSDNAIPKRSVLLDGSSDFVLTYEDKEGDWMLVGDVPWRMFVSTVKRLKIMRTSDVNGLAPKCLEKTDRQKSRLI